MVDEASVEGFGIAEEATRRKDVRDVLQRGAVEECCDVTPAIVAGVVGWCMHDKSGGGSCSVFRGDWKNPVWVQCE